MSSSTSHFTIPVATRTLISTASDVGDETAQLLAALVESSEDAIIGESLDGIITSWNHGAVQMFGYSAQEAIGQSISLLHSPADEDELIAILEMIRRGERTTHFETVRRHKNGSELVVSLSVSPIRDKLGNIIGASKIARDMTAQKRADAILRKAEKLAVAGRLAASVAHEINNPLAALTNLLFLIKGEELSERARQYLEMAERELARTSHITTQALGFYQESTQARQADVSEIVESAVTLHRQRIEVNDIRIERRYRNSSPIHCHAGEIRQVFVNLIGNALDAIPSGGTLRLRVRPGTHWKTAQRGVRVSIADTGCGMSMETLRHLFEPFYTTKGPTRTGLGLWMCEQTVTRHRGRIKVRSRDNSLKHGSIVSLFLPAGKK